MTIQEAFNVDLILKNLKKIDSNCANGRESLEIQLQYWMDLVGYSNGMKLPFCLDLNCNLCPTSTAECKMDCTLSDEKSAFHWSVGPYYHIAKCMHFMNQDLETVVKVLTIAIKNGRILTQITKNLSSREKYSWKGKCLSNQVEFYKSALEKLTLLYCQQGRNSRSLLLEMRCTHRLSTHVLQYKSTQESHYKNTQESHCKNTQESHCKNTQESHCKTAHPSYSDASKYIRVYENVLNDATLDKMSEFLAPNSLFWKSHGYNEFESQGYFSYVYNLNDEPCSFIEQVIQEMFKVVQTAYLSSLTSKIKYAEWWMHCRPHQSGHQMHYDSENEGRGKLRHPLLSSVLCLSENSSIGGPTLVTDQLLSKKELASKGWMSFPKKNRMTIFDASYLHGVVPGQGQSPQSSGRRITFMVGFWDSITINPDTTTHGPSRMCPISANWLLPVDQAVGTSSQLSPSSEPPVFVQSIWQSSTGSELEDLSLPPYDECFQGF